MHDANSTAAAATPGPDLPDAEALAVLAARSRNRSGPLPPHALAAHVVSVTAGADFDVRLAALEALFRRAASAKAEPRLTVRPEGRPGSGRFSLKSPDGGRTYQTRLTALAPVAGSCDCKDFARGSLGLCKHLFAVLEHLAENPQLAPIAARSQPGRPTLRWNPVRPLTGAGDWLARVELCLPCRDEGPIRLDELALRRWFKPPVNGWLALKATFEDAPERRLALVQRLLRLRPLEPALAGLLEEEAARLGLRADDDWAGVELKGALGSLKQPLYPYQREGVERFLRAGRLLLADDMGLGKTAQAIAACHALWVTGRAKRGLIITPASLKAQWVREWSQFCDVPVTAVDGPPAVRARAYEKRRGGFLIANYEQVLRDLPLMQGFAPEVVVLDEAQRIKNWDTRTAALVKQLQPARRLVLTGTPMENRLGELASLVEWVDDHALEPKWRLGPAHAITSDGRRDVVGAKNLDTLRARLSGCMLRRTRGQVLEQLPSRTDTRLPVQLSPRQQEEHDALDTPLFRLLATSRRRPLTQPEFLRLMTLFTQQRIVCNGLAQLQFAEQWPALQKQQPTPAVLESLSSPKLVEFRELVRSVAVDQGRKVVVFSQWRRMLELAHWACADLLAAAGARGLFFTGQETQGRRARNVVDFHDDASARMLFATDAGGVGLNLQRAASCIINLDLPWNPAVLEQRIGRVHRLGQKTPVEVHLLVSDGLESRIAGVVGDKQALFRGLFDGGSDEVRFEQSGSFLARAAALAEIRDVSPATPEDEAEGTTAQAPDCDDSVAPAASAPAVAVDLAAVGAALAQAKVRPLEGGRVSLEVPAPAAAALAQLFAGLAAALAQPSGAGAAGR